MIVMDIGHDNYRDILSEQVLKSCGFNHTAEQLTVVHRDDGSGLNNFGGRNCLVGGHDKGAGDRQEGHVNFFQFFHLGNIVGIAGMIRPRSIYLHNPTNSA